MARAFARRRPAPISFTALVGLVGRNKRRYGGYIVHVGIVLIFLGFAGDGFKKEEQVLLHPGQQTTVGPLHGAARSRCRSPTTGRSR